MELWIRSQDKSNLKKVNNIYVEEITKDYDSWVGNIYSQPYVITSDEGNLGFYATKERALEILDEIQKIWCPPTNFIVSQHIDFDNNGEGLIGCNILKEEPKIERISDVIVYQMPKE